MGSKKIGFIGLGAMGFPMAKNLQKAGFELHVMAHRNRVPVEELVKDGAHEQTSLAEIVKHSEILISILPADKEMEEVLLSDEVINHLTEKHILIEATSGSPDMMKRVNSIYENKGVKVLDAPVSGGTTGAENGTLTVMSGGTDDVLQLVRPVLDAMAQNIYLVGPIGAGKAVKAINQMLAGIHMVASAEAVSLASKLDVDFNMLKEVISNSSGASWMLLNKLDTLISKNFDPGFKLALMRKDIQIAVGEGTDRALPLGAAALQLFRMAEKDFAEKDFAAISQLILT
ncbi:3-hydroxyisobutyrate dehydrogenase-like beta-hydroxyacid dehydrogenase [Pullulanibacillus pueri]|uniref:NAD-dependent L-serine dehydrogenase n=2 Tax=Pullulanibacillus pueri TaxID=1437324 RepID=A0A8J2ZVW8_9BACL|nr:3-hydroxyisobutyrate dehydrogenase-like beta-hydroxyacid dehydrogenase [Pullulanibacillus pueri]GGH82401.1 NAD-dependent L-serine dehydrogenase [Pullulanibacillus pueri]